MSFMSRILVAVLAVLAFPVADAHAIGELRLVPQQYATISDALQASDSADTIVVSPGIYEECPVITGLVAFVINAKRGAIINAAGCEAGVTINDGADIGLRGITVVNATTQGILVKAAASDVHIFKVTVQDTAADPAAALLQTGITVQGANDVTIEGATIVGAKAQGVLVAAASRTVIKKSTIANGLGSGVNVDLGTAISVAKNTMENLDGPAVQLFHFGGTGAQAGAVESLVISNKVIGGGGISIAGQNNLIEKNKLHDTTGVAVEATALSASNSYRKNVSFGAADAGIRAGGVNDTFENNTVKAPLNEGIEIVGSGNDFSVAKVIKAAGSGFLVAPSAIGNTCDACSSKNAGADGFLVEGTANTFSMCKALGSVGLDLNDIAGAATTNTYTNCKFKTSNVP